MAKLFTIPSSIHSLRPQSAAQLKNEDQDLQPDESKFRPYSANPTHDVPNLEGTTALADTKLSTSDGINSVSLKKYSIDPVLEKMVSEFTRRSRLHRAKKRKEKIDSRSTINSWLQKSGSTELRSSAVIGTCGSVSLDESDEYDTDIEEDLEQFNKPREKYEADPSGINCYVRKCIKSGIIPVSFIKRNINKRNVRIRHHYLGPEGTKPLADALKLNTVTENVDLDDNYLQCNGARYIADMMQDNMFIVNLNLSNNFIETTGIKALANMLQENTTLKTLALAGNQLTDRDAILLMEGLKNNETLQSLDLSNNNIGELGGIFLGSVLATNDSLFDLDLSWNCIRRNGAYGVAQALKTNNSLEVLDISWNGIGLEGAIGLRKFLPKNQKLRILDLTNNRLTTEAAKSLAIGLKRNMILETINLNQNAMKDEGVEAILKALKINQVLKLVSLEEVGINDNNHCLIQELCTDTDRGLTILHGGTGGYSRPTAITSTLNIFRVFLERNLTDLKYLLESQDKENDGVLNSDEVKRCLKDIGLRMTNRQLDMLLEAIDSSNTGFIRYRDILDLHIVNDLFKRKLSICRSPIRADPRTLNGMMNMGRQLIIN